MKKVSTPTRGAGSALISPNRTTRTTGWVVTKVMMMILLMIFLNNLKNQGLDDCSADWFL